MRMLLTKVTVVGLLLSSCSNSISTATSTVATQPPSTVSTTSTSVKPPDVTVTLPRTPETPSTTPIPEPEVPRAKMATDECEYPEGSHYCIWGTEPLDLVVNNSRIAYVQQNVVQSFTAVKTQISKVEMPLQTSDIGELVLLSQSKTPLVACLSVHLMSESGLRIASASYGDAGGVGRLQQVEVPLIANLLVGRKFQLQISKEPACLVRSLAVRVAMSSKWKYPKASGGLTLDSNSSIGSLWARIE